MKKFLLFALLSSFALADSVVPTPDVPATPPSPGAPAVPGKVTIATTSGNISGTLTGNAVPATAVLVSLTVNGVAINFTMPVATGQTYLESHRITVGAVTDTLTYSLAGAAAGIAYSVTLNSAAAVNGTL